MIFLSANRIAPDGTPRFAASHLGLYSVCLRPIKMTRGLYGLKQIFAWRCSHFLTEVGMRLLQLETVEIIIEHNQSF